ncbi:hypothetical protein Tco_1020343 [Tanacetum coccineum]|uniref:Uncharacterized protein n=1 Tax=Tanacetum coccineum TaxID=301880 RepID=A0ABQ5FZV5_9ASTR
MAGRSTRSNTANNTNPPKAQQLNTALSNLLTQLVQALRGNRANQERSPKAAVSRDSWILRAKSNLRLVCCKAVP